MEIMSKNYVEEMYRKHSQALTFRDGSGRVLLKINPEYEGPLDSEKASGCVWCGAHSTDDTFGNCLACGGIRVLGRT